jgi:hypothetical protein
MQPTFVVVAMPPCDAMAGDWLLDCAYQRVGKVLRVVGRAVEIDLEGKRHTCLAEEHMATIQPRNGPVLRVVRPLP